MKKIDNIIPIKYFYDQTGSQLYDEIMRVPDYYLFQSEKGILCKYASKICESIEPDSIILEIGYSNSEKILSSITPFDVRIYGNNFSENYPSVENRSLYFNNIAFTLAQAPSKPNFINENVDSNSQLTLTYNVQFNENNVNVSNKFTNIDNSINKLLNDTNINDISVNNLLVNTNVTDNSVSNLTTQVNILNIAVRIHDLNPITD